MSNKITQKDLILNFLKSNPKTKLTAERAMKLTKSASVKSMNFLLPSMLRDGSIARVKVGTYKLAGDTSITAPAPVVKTKAIKTTRKVIAKTFTKETGIKSKLIAKKEELLSQVSNIDKHIEAIDKVYALSSKLLS